MSSHTLQFSSKSFSVIYYYLKDVDKKYYFSNPFVRLRLFFSLLYYVYYAMLLIQNLCKYFFGCLIFITLYLCRNNIMIIF